MERHELRDIMKTLTMINEFIESQQSVNNTIFESIKLIDEKLENLEN